MESRDQTTDFDKKAWQDAQAAQDAARQARREKWEKARLRSARRARRKLEKLKITLEASGELTDWEDDFAESVSERLDEFGTAFHDPEKGSPSDALSFAQKKVIAALSKKARSSSGQKMTNADETNELQPIDEASQVDGPEPSSELNPKPSPKPFLRLVK